MLFNLREKVNDLRNYAVKGFQEFNEDRLGYTKRALGQAAKDYWELLGIGLGVAIAENFVNREFFLGFDREVAMSLILNGFVAPFYCERGLQQKAMRTLRNSGFMGAYAACTNADPVFFGIAAAYIPFMEWFRKRESFSSDNPTTPSAPATSTVPEKEVKEKLTDLLNVEYNTV